MLNKTLLLLMTALLSSFSMHAHAYTNAIDMEFIDISPGCFRMWRDNKIEGGGDLQHKVCLKAYKMSKTEVTQAQWEKVMDNNPSKFKEQTAPVEQVSWKDAKRFVKRLNQAEGTSKYRLPTEAQWEYAARAGTTSNDYSFGNSANKWGLEDMPNNVWEWVEDCGQKNYQGAPSDGSAWISNCQKNSKRDTRRVLRGSYWSNGSDFCSSGLRATAFSEHRSHCLGFRLVREQ